MEPPGQMGGLSLPTALATGRGRPGTSSKPRAPLQVPDNSLANLCSHPPRPSLGREGPTAQGCGEVSKCTLCRGRQLRSRTKVLNIFIANFFSPTSIFLVETRSHCNTFTFLQKMRQIRAITVTRGSPRTLTRTGWGGEHTIGQDMDPSRERQVQRERAASDTGIHT